MIDNKIGSKISTPGGSVIRRTKKGWRNNRVNHTYRSFIAALVGVFAGGCTLADLARALNQKKGPTLADCFGQDPGDTLDLIKKIWLAELYQIYTGQRWRRDGTTQSMLKNWLRLRGTIKNLRELRDSMAKGTTVHQTLDEALQHFAIVMGIRARDW